MAKIGDAFPDVARRNSLVRRLRPGVVVNLEITFPEGRRSKYLVVAHVDEQCCTLIVNSDVHRFIESKPELAICQVRIDAARHAFLRHDSHIACHEVLRLPTPAVIRDLTADMDRIKGELHEDVRMEVIAAIKRAPTLS
ncbi:MAG: hypothetical protein ACREUO_12945, partial [Burkholderiales bacterium]